VLRDCRPADRSGRTSAPDCRCPRSSGWWRDRRCRSPRRRRRWSARHWCCPCTSRCRARRAAAARALRPRGSAFGCGNAPHPAFISVKAMDGVNAHASSPSGPKEPANSDGSFSRKQPSAVCLGAILAHPTAYSVQLRASDQRPRSLATERSNSAKAP
jgi:hypothetical protein